MKKENIPNALCYFRIIITPVIFLMITLGKLIDSVPFLSFVGDTAFGRVLLDGFYSGMRLHILISGIIFGLAMATDAIDGNYARKHGMVSDKGKILDPLSDKILILGTMLAFWVYNGGEGYNCFMLIPLGIIFAREIIVSYLRKLTAKRGAVIGASIWGKVKTVIQTASVAVCFIAYLSGCNPAADIAIVVAAAVTFASLFPYLKMYGAKLKELKNKQ